MEKKPTLRELRRQTSITSLHLAQEAGVSISQEYLVEIGGCVHPAVAEKVMAAFCRSGQVSYTIHDIALHGGAVSLDALRRRNHREDRRA